MLWAQWDGFLFLKTHAALSGTYKYILKEFQTSMNSIVWDFNQNFVSPIITDNAPLVPALLSFLSLFTHDRTLGSGLCSTH